MKIIIRLMRKKKMNKAELMKMGIYEDYEIMDIEKKKMELMKKEEEKI